MVETYFCALLVLREMSKELHRYIYVTCDYTVLSCKHLLLKQHWIIVSSSIHLKIVRTLNVAEQLAEGLTLKLSIVLYNKALSQFKTHDLDYCNFMDFQSNYYTVF